MAKQTCGVSEMLDNFSLEHVPKTELETIIRRSKKWALRNDKVILPLIEQSE